MKKILALLIAIVLIAGMAGAALADDGTVTVTSTPINGRDWEVFHFAYIANSTGVVPSTSTTVETCASRLCYPRGKAGYIWKVVNIPGSPNPATDFDITITDDGTGLDLTGGEGADLSNTTGNEFLLKVGNAFGGNLVYSSFTVNWIDVTNPLAAGRIDVYIVY